MTANPCENLSTAVFDADSELPDFFLLSTGDCSINTKVFNAQNAGAALAIIVNKDNISSDQLSYHQLDDLSLKITIPTLVISKDVASKVFEILEKQPIILKFGLPIPKENKVQIDITMRYNDTRMYTLLEDFRPYFDQFDDNLSLKITLYKTSLTDGVIPKMQVDINCLGAANAISLLLAFHKECKNQELDCFESKVGELPKREYEEYLNCVKDSALEYFKLQKSLPIETTNTKSFILINHMYFTGSMTAPAVFNAVCGGFIISPGQCLYADSQYTLNAQYQSIRSEKRNNTLLILFLDLAILLVLLILAAFIMMIVFGKIYRRILEERVATIVKESISSYEALKTMN